MKKTLLLLIVLCVNAGLEAQLSKTVDITAGGLNSALTSTEKATVTELIITGLMNSTDFSNIRSYMPLLEKLDLSGCTLTNDLLPNSALYGKTGLKEVILPNSLKTIDSHAFYNCYDLTTVTMPDSLRLINYAAFHQCYELSGSLIIPQKVRFIDNYAFYRCYKINSLTLSDSLQTIGSYAFQQCRMLSGQLIIPSKVTSMGYQTFEGTKYSTAKLLTPLPPSTYTGSSFSMLPIVIFYVLPEAKTAFRNDTKWNPYIIIGGDTPVKVTVNLTTAGTLGEQVLQQVEYLKDVNELNVSGLLNAADVTLLKDNFPDLISLNMKNTNVTDIPNYQFQNRYYIRNVELPDSLQTIGTQAFYRCNDLQEIVIPRKVKVINDNAFYDCFELKKVTLPPTLTNIKYQAFGYNYMLADLVLPDSLVEIANYAFQNCYELDSIVIPSKITNISYAAFNECSKLKYVKFPEKLVSLRSYAFQSCPIDTLIFPTTLQIIESSTFNNNSVLKHIVCQQPTPPVLSSDPFNTVVKTTCTLEVPFWSMNMYKQAPIWTNFATVVPFNKELKEIPVSGPLALVNNVRPTGFPNITILSNGSLTVGGNTPFPTDRFSIEGRYNTSVFGNLINDCPAMSANSVTLRLEVNGSKWYFLSFPFNVRVADIKTTTNALFAVRGYDGAARAQNGTGGSWKTMTTDSILLAGRGYIINANATTTLIFPSTSESRNQLFNHEEKSTPLSVYTTDVTANKSWNFIGNAYPSFYDSRYLDFTAPITVWNLNNNTYTAISLIDDKYAIKPFEGFFVQKPEDISQMTFLKGGRQLSAVLSVNGPAGAPHKIKASADRTIVNLALSNDQVSDATRIVFNPLASSGYEMERDASKFFSNEPSVPQLFSIDEAGNTYAINERPGSPGWVKLGYTAGTRGSLQLKKADNTSEDLIQLLLEDKLTSTTTDLLSGDYNFTSDAGTFTDRFLLRITSLATGLVPTGTTEVIKGEREKIIILSETGKTFRVYNVNGILIRTVTTDNTVTEVNLPSGVYLIRSNADTHKTVVF